MQNTSENIEINTVLELLKLLTKRNISQTELGESLNTSRSNISLRCKNKSLLTPEEIEKINKFFNVTIDIHANSKKNIIMEHIKEAWNISDVDAGVVLTILENKNSRAITKMLFSVLRGNTEAKEALIGILNIPEIAKTFVE